MVSEFTWCALQVRPRAEKFVSTILNERGVPSLLPLYKARKRWADRYKLLDLPLFPGYVFSHFDARCQNLVLSTPGVVDVVRIGNNPAVVDASEIFALKRLIDSQLPCLPYTAFEIGEPIRIIAGPLAGLSGCLVSLKNSVRLLLSVTLLNRSVIVEIDREWAVSLRHARPALAGTSHAQSHGVSDWASELRLPFANDAPGRSTGP